MNIVLVVILLGFLGAFIAGMAGIGGAIIMVPLLYFVPPILGFEQLSMQSPQGDAKWEVYSGGGHHVINYLLFPDNGFITTDTKYVKLVIKDFINLSVREFIWEKEFLGI